jgi:hypothetical protein
MITDVNKRYYFVWNNIYCNNIPNGIYTLAKIIGGGDYDFYILIDNDGIINGSVKVFLSSEKYVESMVEI